MEYNSNSYFFPEEPFRFLLKKECARAQRYAHFLSVVMVKLSELDAPLLTTTAKIIQGAVRESDMMGSLQDKHLVVILPHADAQSKDDIVTRIRGRLREYNHGLSQPLMNPRVKVGAACFPTDAPTCEDLLKAAEERSSEPDTDP